MCWGYRYLLVACIIAGTVGRLPVMVPDDDPESGSGEAALAGASLPELGAGAPSWVGGPVGPQLGPIEESVGSGEAGSGEGSGSGNIQ